MTEQHQALPPLEVTVMCNVTIPKWEWKDGKYGRAEGGWLCIERDGDERALIHMYGLYDADTLRLVADVLENPEIEQDRKSTRLNSSHIQKSRMPSSA